MGLTLAEVDALPHSELEAWATWVQYQNDQVRKAQKRGRTKRQRMGRRRR